MLQRQLSLPRSIRHLAASRVFSPSRSFFAATALFADPRKSVTPDHTLPPRSDGEVRQPPRKLSPKALFSLEGRTIVLSGAGRGLGITLASAVLGAGGDVVCLDILPRPSEIEWASISKIGQERGQKASYYQCDITNEDDVRATLEKAATQAEESGKAIRGLITCAGINQVFDAIDYPLDGFKKVLDVNVTGSFLVAKYTARLMRDAKNGGSIVFVASMSGQIANRGLRCSAYNSSKAAVQQMSRSLSVEWGIHDIRVNSLSPGYIRTAMTDALLATEPHLEKTWMAGALLGRLGTVEDFKAPAVFLLADGSGFMTGADLRVDGGHCASA